jgi:hypothetical protein
MTRNIFKSSAESGNLKKTINFGAKVINKNTEQYRYQSGAL